MTEVKPVVKKWEDIEIDVLVKIFKELNMIELSPVSQVCRSWCLASSDPLLWETLDLGLLKSNFIQTRASPYIWVDERSDRKLSKLLKIAMAISRGNIINLIFHFNLYMKDDHLICIAERCPRLKRLVMPAWNRITKTGICQAISKWKDLESLTMPSIAHPPYIISEIGRSCRRFSALKVMGTFDVHFASAVATCLPGLRTLSLRCSIVTTEALVFLLDCLDHLEALNISHCMIFESQRKKTIVREPSSEIQRKASRLREFYWCRGKGACLACERMVKDEGLMRWYRYEESFWREDEVRSLALGRDYGRLFDEGCLGTGFGN